MRKKRYRLIYDDDELGSFITDTQEQFSEDVHSWDILCDILNEQDARIKELEKIRDKGNQKLENFYNKKIDELDNDYNKHLDELIKENQQLKEEIRQLKYDCAMYKSANHLINDVGIDKAREIMFQSEQQLKQSQNQKAVEVLEKFRDYFAIKDTNLNAYDIVADYGDILDWISDKIKELRGGENE